MSADLQKIQSLFPGRIVTKILDYNKKCYVVEVVDKINEVNYDDPYYVVTKKDYKKELFLPNLDLDTFFNKLEHSMIYNIEET